MNTKSFFFAFVFSSGFCHIAPGQNPANLSTLKKVNILIHITRVPENPTQAALGYVPKTAIEVGHMFTLFLAGDAEKLLQDLMLNTLNGVGTEKLSVERPDAYVLNHP